MVASARSTRGITRLGGPTSFSVPGRGSSAARCGSSRLVPCTGSTMRNERSTCNCPRSRSRARHTPDGRARPWACDAESEASADAAHTPVRVLCASTTGTHLGGGKRATSHGDGGRVPAFDQVVSHQRRPPGRISSRVVVVVIVVAAGCRIVVACDAPTFDVALVGSRNRTNRPALGEVLEAVLVNGGTASSSMRRFTDDADAAVLDNIANLCGAFACELAGRRRQPDAAGSP